MIVNTTAEFNTSVSRMTAYTFDSTPVLRIVKPDGTTDDTSTVNVLPVGSAALHNLQGFYTPAVVGRYSSQWRYVIGGTPFNDVSVSFQVTYSDVNTSIRTLLGVNVNALPDMRLDIEFRKFIVFVTAYVPTFNYAELDTNDAELFDYGVEYIIAATLRTSGGFFSNSPNSQITEIRQGPVMRRYADTSSALIKGSLRTDAEIWFEIGCQFMAKIGILTSFISTLQNKGVAHVASIRIGVDVNTICAEFEGRTCY